MSLFLANKLCQSYGDYGVMFWERWRDIYELRGEFKGSLLIWNNVYSQASPVTFLWLHWWCRTFSCFFMCACVCECVCVWLRARRTKHTHTDPGGGFRCESDSGQGRKQLSRSEGTNPTQALSNTRTTARKQMKNKKKQRLFARK